MSRLRGRSIEVDSLAAFDALVHHRATRMRGWTVRDIDLTDRTGVLLALDPAGALFLGCRLNSAATDWLQRGGALLFPDVPDLPFDPYRGTLYSPEELYAGIASSGYQRTPDARIYAWSRKADAGVEATLASALHDHAIGRALDDTLTGVRAVGVMGGHGVQRPGPDYARAAGLGARLAAAGFHVVTGGGPGAMEAANLGAYMSAQPEALGEAIQLLARVPGFRPSVTRWADAAFTVRNRWGDGVASTGIPDWFYGHEPPNAFASTIAKFFQNSLREATLLRRCDAGIVFLPGAAGTVQEIFQDACENYYADDATVAPMVLVGRRHWTQETPAWPLLQILASTRAMAGHIHLVDTADEAAELLSASSPRR